MKSGVLESLEKRRRTRDRGAWPPSLARIVVGACFLNFLVFVISFLLVCSSGKQVDSDSKHKPYVLTNKGSYYLVTPAAYYYVRIHEAVTVVSFLPAIAASVFVLSERLSRDNSLRGRGTT